MKWLRTFILLFFMMFIMNVGAQNFIKKWNDFYKRYDYFDCHCVLKGYYKYNDFYKRWEYYEK